MPHSVAPTGSQQAGRTRRTSAGPDMSAAPAATGASAARELDDIDLTRAVDHLAPGTTGRWLVHSRTSTHLLDLDDRLYTRIPGDDAMPLPYDLEPIALLRITPWPRVGGQMLVWADADDAGLLEQ